MTYISLPEIPTTATITAKLLQTDPLCQTRDRQNVTGVLRDSETLSSGVGYRQENHRRVDSQLHQQTLFRCSRGIRRAPLSSFVCSVSLSQLSISLTCTSSTMCFYHCLSLSRLHWTADVSFIRLVSCSLLHYTVGKRLSREV